MERSLAVLLIDDDPVHLQIYGWLLKNAGFHTYPALVSGGVVRLPEDHTINAVIIDYRISGNLKVVEATKLIRDVYPTVPIILLVDVYDMPEDITPHITAFVYKGQPDKLIAAVNSCAV